MGYKLFLDDKRTPAQCVSYMHRRIGRLNPIYIQNEWVICRNYVCFKNTIEKMGLPEFVSFDHDLADEHYGISEDGALEEYYGWEGRTETGYDCAKWLVDYCMEHKLELPQWAVHSMNPIGVGNITSYLKQAEKWILKK